VPDSLPGLVLDANIAFHLGSYAQAETSVLKGSSRRNVSPG
jgi:hypothetical protein